MTQLAALSHAQVPPPSTTPDATTAAGRVNAGGAFVGGVLVRFCARPDRAARGGRTRTVSRSQDPPRRELTSVVARPPSDRHDLVEDPALRRLAGLARRLRDLRVISALDAIDYSLLMAQQRHRYAGIPT